VVPNWQSACQLCYQLLEFGGLGHTLVLHSKNDRLILEFALRKPVYRILVNTPASQGAIGATTGLEPALTLGCGTMGGSITADNITPLHLIHIKRLAYDKDGPPLPAVSVFEQPFESEIITPGEVPRIAAEEMTPKKGYLKPLDRSLIEGIVQEVLKEKGLL
jgi:acetaldehyde dehydrogenase (acetylating)